MSLVKRMLAAVCSVCPFCIARRRFPKSGYARFMAKMEEGCPFCRAYEELEAERSKTASDNDRQSA
jgi:hypothetical protein